MKKIFTIALSLLASLSVSAQREAGTFTIQPKIGLSVGTHVGSYDKTQYTAKARLGFIGGVEAEYVFVDNFSVAAGVVYQAQGYNRKAKFYSFNGEGITSTEREYSIALDYINIPVVVNYYVYKGLAVKAGIQPGLMLSLNYDGKSVGSASNSFALGIPVGVSYEFNGGLVLDARAVFGLNSYQIANETDKWRNNAFSLTIGYKFGM